MKAPHLMTPLERREAMEARLENARYLAKVNTELARGNASRPKLATQYTGIAEGLNREARRLKMILDK